MVGDTPYDVEAGRHVGVRMIALRCGGWTNDALADAVAIYDDPEDRWPGTRHRRSRGRPRFVRTPFRRSRRRFARTCHHARVRTSRADADG